MGDTQKINSTTTNVLPLQQLLLLLQTKGIVIIRPQYLRIILVLLVHKTTDSCWGRFFLANLGGTPLRGVVRSAMMFKDLKANGVQTPKVSTKGIKSAPMLLPSLQLPDVPHPWPSLQLQQPPQHKK